MSSVPGRYVFLNFGNPFPDPESSQKCSDFNCHCNKIQGFRAWSIPGFCYCRPVVWSPFSPSLIWIGGLFQFSLCRINAQHFIQDTNSGKPGNHQINAHDQQHNAPTVFNASVHIQQAQCYAQHDPDHPPGISDIPFHVFSFKVV